MSKELALTLSQRVQRIKPSPTLAVSARAEELQRQGMPIINLSVGEPDFDTPAHIKEAAIAALNAGQTKYTEVDGIKSLRGAICDKYARENNLNYDLKQVLVSCGAKHSLFNIFAAILNAGDEVIIPAPYWVSYPDMVKLLDGEPVIVKTEFSQQLKMTPVQLQAAITPRTRALILNSPCNPSGMAYSTQELQALGEVLLHYPNILIITDDIYEHTLWNQLPFNNIVNACPELYDRTVVVNGVAKSYAMTGWRIGYAVGPANIIAAMKKIQSQSTSCATSIAQYAVQAALEGDQTCVDEMRLAYHLRHNFLCSALEKIEGFKCLPSDGTFYSFPKITDLLQTSVANSDLDFAELLLNEAQIAVVPGSAFGTPGHIRISYATSMQNLEIAVERLKKVVNKLKHAA
jgi:aspartate aminotransferase